MLEPDPHRLYAIRCAACGIDLGTTYARHADMIGEVHAPKCRASVAQYDQGLAAVMEAQKTGNTTALKRIR